MSHRKTTGLGFSLVVLLSLLLALNGGHGLAQEGDDPISGEGSGLVGEPVPDKIIYLPIIGKHVPPVWMGPYGGSVVSLAADPNNGSIVYAGSWGGGVHKSTDGGSTWVFSGAGLGVSQIDSLAVDPYNTSIVYAGTHGGGVYKSDNAGASWYAVNNGIQAKAVVYTITVNPGNHDLIYAGTRGAPETPGPPWLGVLYKSTNGGASWNAVLTDVGGSGAQDWVYSVRSNPTSPNIILAATHEHGPYIADDYGGAGDWQTPSNPPDGSGRAVAFDPRSWMHTAYYATWHLSGLYLSNNSGTSWYQSNSGLGNAKIYPNGIAIEPGAPDRVYMASFGDAVHGVMKSTNAGGSWTLAGLSSRYIYSVVTPGNSKDIVIAGTYQDGAYKSTNGGLTWTRAMTGLINSNVTGLVSRTANEMYGATNGSGVYRSTNGGATWSEFNPNLSDSIILGLVQHPTNPNLLYALTQNSGLRKIDLTSGGWVQASIPFSAPAAQAAGTTADDPLSRKEPMDELLGHLPAEAETQSAAAITAATLSMTFAPSDSQIAYVGTSGSGIYKSTNSGVSWAAAGLAGASVRSMAVNATNALFVYAATAQAGMLKVTQNGGATWGDTPAIAGSPSIYSVAFSPSEPGVVLAGTSNGIYKYSGAAWSAVGLSGLAVTVLEPSPFTPGVVYAGTSSGVYQSDPNQAQWYMTTPETIGFAIPAIDFALDSQGSKIMYVGTNMHGTLKVYLQ